MTNLFASHMLEQQRHARAYQEAANNWIAHVQKCLICRFGFLPICQKQQHLMNEMQGADLRLSNSCFPTFLGVGSV
jgi:hypothetical protein